MNPENMEDAYLSLYVTNVESALGFKNKIESGNEDQKVKELYQKRIETAREYLGKLESDDVGHLRDEFEVNFGSRDNSNRRAA